MNKNAFAYTLICLAVALALIGLTMALPVVGYVLAGMMGLYGTYALTLRNKEGDSARVMAGIGLTPALAVATLLLVQIGMSVLALFVGAAAVMMAISLGRRIYP